MFSYPGRTGPDPGGFSQLWNTSTGKTSWETGWSVLPGLQGQGIAVRATLLAIDKAREEGKYRFFHAFPRVDNAPSNGVCRKAGV